MSAVLLNDGQAFVTNGSGVHSGVSNIYNPITETFFETTYMIMEHYEPAISLLDSGNVFIIGREIDISGGSAAEIYNPQTDSFTLVANTGIFDISDKITDAATIFNGDVLIASMDAMHVYYHTTGQFAQIGRFGVDYGSDKTVTFWPNGQFLVVGGSNSPGTAQFGTCSPMT